MSSVKLGKLTDLLKKQQTVYKKSFVQEYSVKNVLGLTAGDSCYATIVSNDWIVVNSHKIRAKSGYSLFSATPNGNAFDQNIQCSSTSEGESAWCCVEAQAQMDLYRNKEKYPEEKAWGNRHTITLPEHRILLPVAIFNHIGDVSEWENISLSDKNYKFVLLNISLGKCFDAFKNAVIEKMKTTYVLNPSTNKREKMLKGAEDDESLLQAFQENANKFFYKLYLAPIGGQSKGYVVEFIPILRTEDAVAAENEAERDSLVNWETVPELQDFRNVVAEFLELIEHKSDSLLDTCTHEQFIAHNARIKAYETSLKEKEEEKAPKRETLKMLNSAEVTITPETLSPPRVSPAPLVPPHVADIADFENDAFDFEDADFEE